MFVRIHNRNFNVLQLALVVGTHCISMSQISSFFFIDWGGFPFRAPDLHATVFPVQGGFLQLGSLDMHHARTAVRGSTHIRGMRATTPPWILRL